MVYKKNIDTYLESVGRDLISKWYGKEVFWYEAARGGTIGVADCQVTVDHRLIPIELKKGQINTYNERGYWTPILRPAQFQMHRRYVELGLTSFVLVVDFGDGHLWMAESKHVIEAAFVGNEVQMVAVASREAMDAEIRRVFDIKRN